LFTPPAQPREAAVFPPRWNNFPHLAQLVLYALRTFPEPCIAGFSLQVYDQFFRAKSDFFLFSRFQARFSRLICFFFFEHPPPFSARCRTSLHRDLASPPRVPRVLGCGRSCPGRVPQAQCASFNPRCRYQSCSRHRFLGRPPFLALIEPLRQVCSEDCAIDVRRPFSFSP